MRCPLARFHTFASPSSRPTGTDCAVWALGKVGQVSTCTDFQCTHQRLTCIVRNQQFGKTTCWLHRLTDSPVADALMR